MIRTLIVVTNHIKEARIRDGSFKYHTHTHPCTSTMHNDKNSLKLKSQRNSLKIKCAKVKTNRWTNRSFKLKSLCLQDSIAIVRLRFVNRDIRGYVAHWYTVRAHCHVDILWCRRRVCAETVSGPKFNTGRWTAQGPILTQVDDFNRGGRWQRQGGGDTCKKIRRGLAKWSQTNSVRARRDLRRNLRLWRNLLFLPKPVVWRNVSSGTLVIRLVVC
jgi:hypothetical protein